MKVAVIVAGLFLSSWTCMILKTVCGMAGLGLQDWVGGTVKPHFAVTW